MFIGFTLYCNSYMKVNRNQSYVIVIIITTIIVIITITITKIIQYNFLQYDHKNICIIIGKIPNFKLENKDCPECVLHPCNI